MKYLLICENLFNLSNLWSMNSLQQSITDLDIVIRWGINSKRISGKMLEKFQGVLRSLAELHEAGDISQSSDSEVSRVTEKLTRLWQLGRLTGLTAKAIAEIENTDDDFLRWYESTGLTINSNLDFEVFLHHRRRFTRLCETDLNNIRWYAQISQIVINWKANHLSQASKESHELFLHNQLQFLHELYPHLTPWFILIDQGQEVDEEDANNKLYLYHLKN